MSYYGTTTTHCFVAYDGNGNVSALINASNGVTVANYDYGPFGELIRASGPMAKLNPFRFSTRYDDDESDLLCYGYRYYNPSTGRWLSRDPVDELGFKQFVKPIRTFTRGKSRPYCFVANNAINEFDILGLQRNGPSGPAVHCQDPCKWARDNDHDGDIGVTVCCNHKKYGCVLKSGGSTGATDPEAVAFIDHCTQVHEDTHVNDPNLKCPLGPCGWTGPYIAEYDLARTTLAGDCAAYSAEESCLSAALEMCTSDSCEQQVLAELQVVSQEVYKNCSQAH